jgi:hypothetical protein
VSRIPTKTEIFAMLRAENAIFIETAYECCKLAIARGESPTATIAKIKQFRPDLFKTKPMLRISPLASSEPKSRRTWAEFSSFSNLGA